MPTQANGTCNCCDKLKLPGRGEWDKMDLVELLQLLGEDIDREGLQDTPRRVMAAWYEMLQGYTMSPEEILSTSFEAEGQGFQLASNIEFTSVCEHHLLPFSGHCWIGYKPHKRVLGLSKLARLVDCFSRRLQIQERMVQQICDALVEALGGEIVVVAAVAKHGCCFSRGVQRRDMNFITTAQHGDQAETYTALLLERILQCT